MSGGGYGPFPYITTPKAPPAVGTRCYFCREPMACRWAGHVKPELCDIPICEGCDDRAKRAKRR